MKQRLSLLALAGMLLVLPGCYAMDIDATALEPHVYMSVQSQGEQPQRLGEFETKLTGSWLLFGLMKLKDPNLRDALQREIQRANGTRITGLEITTKQTFLDGLLTAITFNLYGQRTTILSGTVVR